MAASWAAMTDGYEAPASVFAEGAEPELFVLFLEKMWRSPLPPFSTAQNLRFAKHATL
jgi:hypothetical protein